MQRRLLTAAQVYFGVGILHSAVHTCTEAYTHDPEDEIANSSMLFKEYFPRFLAVKSVYMAFLWPVHTYKILRDLDYEYPLDAFRFFPQSEKTRQNLNEKFYNHHTFGMPFREYPRPFFPVPNTPQEPPEVPRTRFTRF